MSCDELAQSNECRADFESDCPTSSKTKCIANATSSRHCDDLDLVEDRLWVI
jgi:hypothetical protein